MSEPRTQTTGARAPVSVSDNPDLTRVFIEEATTHLVQIETTLKVLSDQPSDTDAVQTLFTTFHNLKGSAGMVFLHDIVDIAHETEFLLEAIIQRKTAVSPPIWEALDKGRKLTLQIVHKVSHALRTSTSVPANPKVPKHLESLRGLLMGLLLTSRLREVSDDEDTIDLPRLEARTAGRVAPLVEPIIKDTVTSMKEQVTQLSQQQAALLDSLKWIDDISPEKKAGLIQVHQGIRKLQQMVEELIVQPFNAFRPVVEGVIKQTCDKTGKQVQLAFTGSGVEIPRAYVTPLRTALTHLVRNAVVHGIDTRGTIVVSATASNDKITVVVEDDGRGLDEAKLRKTAQRFHLLDSARSQSAVDLAFIPGLSTVDKVTPEAGRGVGLDAVRRAIRAVGGRVSAESTPGKGCRFELHLPHA